MHNFKIGDRVELNQNAKDQGIWARNQDRKATVIKIWDSHSVQILPDGNKSPQIFSAGLLQKETLTDRKLTDKDWLAMAHCFTLEPGINLTKYRADEWLIVDDKHLIVVTKSDQTPYATKEEAYTAYLEWKKYRDQDAKEDRGNDR